MNISSVRDELKYLSGVVEVKESAINDIENLKRLRWDLNKMYENYLITKEKKYKTVTATRITNNGQYERDELHEDRKKYVLKYEWTVDGKTYRRTIVTSAWPLPVDTFYYLNNPKYAMPLPEELSKFKHTKALFLISFLIAFIFMLNK